jgi:Cu(I)/Ag(I) efflux system membrane protein CusA/SilA
MVLHLRSSLLISGLLPLAVLMCFIAMKTFGVDANIVALSGIAIAIGIIVDMGIVVCENILKHLDAADPQEDSLEVICRACGEVGSAVLTAIATTIVSFMAVFTMEAAEGKLFKPLAFTYTFVLFASVIVALAIIPPFAHILFTGRISREWLRNMFYGALILVGVIASFVIAWWVGVLIIFIGGYHLGERWFPEDIKRQITWVANLLAVLVVAILLSEHWLPLGPERGFVLNFIFAVLLIGGVLGLFYLFMHEYGRLLKWCLDHKAAFLSVPLVITLLGLLIWLGFDSFFGWVPNSVKRFGPVSYIAHKFPGLGKEFMPPLDEGSYLFMPTTMPHASIGEVLDVLQKQDMAMYNIPEVDTVVGKLGRVESPLDPAPVSMIETVINYKPEYIVDRNGRRVRFRFSPDETDFFRSEDGSPLLAPDGKPYKVSGSFIRDDNGDLIPDDDGRAFRLWRPALNPDLNEGREGWEGIKEPDNIWEAIVKATEIPGTTSAPRLQPIMARIVMLQSGMRAPMGVKVKGPSLEVIEKVGLQVERFLKEVPSIEPAMVIADRIIGKPYLEIDIDRKAIARYGIKLRNVQDVIEVAIGGKRITTTVEGRERYPVRVRYMRELRDNIEALGRILVPAPDGSQIPLEQLAKTNYIRGPQMIKSEDTFLVGYVLFDKKPGYAEVDVVEQAQEYLNFKIASGEFQIPAGVSFAFAGSYENQVRAQKRLAIILPLALFIIFMIIYFQFKSTPTTFLVFSGILVCWAGGFILVWLYAQSWFLNFSLFGTDMRELFQVHPVNLSVAVWVGFLVLFGIATDNGVIMATYLNQTFSRKKPISVGDIRAATIEAGKRRVRPCLMTTATTILALIPVLTSTGRGSDVMVPMAIPSFGGMVINVITLFLVPVLYCTMKEFRQSIK